MSLVSTLGSKLSRNIVFVHGKGGVGKSVVTQAIAQRLSSKGESTLWVALEDPTRPAGELKVLGPHLKYLNCDFISSFEEYVAMKIGAPRLTRIFLQNKLIQYLAKAAPGIHEMVLLGKIWFERAHYSHVVVDMPSTGYGLAMFQCTENFSKLFKGGPLYRDAEAMLNSFKDPQETSHLIVSLPEETPLRESMELRDFLKALFPENAPAYLVNRVFPKSEQSSGSHSGLPTDESALWKGPIAKSAVEYATRRALLEEYNLRLWRDESIAFEQLDYVPPPPRNAQDYIANQVQSQLEREGLL